MPDNRKLLLERMSSFENACREAGLRLTHQRLEVYRELSEAFDHPSAESLHKRLRARFPTISLDTVYRTLSTLERHGMIKRVETVDSQSRFDATEIRHHHLICARCREIADFSWQAIDNETLPEEISSWGRIDNKSVVLYGVCKKCLKKTMQGENQCTT